MESLYCEVEKRKKGEVSLKAATECSARAAAHILLVAIVDEELMWVQTACSCSYSYTMVDPTRNAIS